MRCTACRHDNRDTAKFCERCGSELTGVGESDDERPALAIGHIGPHVDAARTHCSGMKLAPTEIVRGKIHDHFTLTDPAGWIVTITSSHAVGVV